MAQLRWLPLVLLLGACGGGDETCVKSSESIPGVFIRGIEDMPQDGCVNGALAGLDPTGVWFVERANQRPFGGSGPVSIEGECGEVPTVTVGLSGSVAVYDEFVATNSYWMWHQVESFDGGFFERAYLICADDDGVLRGHYQRCFAFDEAEDCGTESIEMTPYGLIEGEPEAEGVELISEYHGDGDGWPAAFSANVRVKDDIAYFVHGTDGLRIIDVSDITNPFEIGFLEAESDFFNDVKLTEDPNGKLYALIASDVFGVLSVDVSDPTAPVSVATFTVTGQPMEGVHTIFVDTFAGAPAAYIVDGSSGVLGVYDITDPALPSRVAQYFLGDDPAFHDLYVEGGVVYLNATVGGFLVIDPSLDEPNLGFFDSGDYSHSNWVTTAGGRKVAVHGGEGFDAHIKIVDVDPDSPQYMQMIGEWQTREQVSVHNIMAFGDRAYMAHYEDGLRVLDLSDPTDPKQIAHFNSWSPDNWDGSYFAGMAGLDVDLDRGLIFASDSERGLMILRLTVDD